MATLEEEISERLAQLDPAQQRAVLDYANALAESPPPDGSGAALLRFAGTMDPEVAREIAEAIEVLVDVLDLLGGDPDKEDATDSEDDHALSPQATWVLEGNARLPGQRYRRVDWR